MFEVCPLRLGGFGVSVPSMRGLNFLDVESQSPRAGLDVAVLVLPVGSVRNAWEPEPQQVV